MKTGEFALVKNIDTIAGLLWYTDIVQGDHCPLIF